MCSVAIVLGRGTLNAGQNAMMYQSLYFSYPRSKEESYQIFFPPSLVFGLNAQR